MLKENSIDLFLRNRFDELGLISENNEVLKS